MANSDRPRGLEPSGELMRLCQYEAAGLTFPGEIVRLDSAGRVTVGVSAATGPAIGVALTYASAAGQPVSIADHPQQQFVVQVDDANISQQTDLNLNYSVLGTSENATYKISRDELDGSSGVTTATVTLKALRIEPRVGNALGGQVDVIVQINNHGLSGGTGTAGI